MVCILELERFQALQPISILGHVEFSTGIKVSHNIPNKQTGQQRNKPNHERGNNSALASFPTPPQGNIQAASLVARRAKKSSDRETVPNPKPRADAKVIA